MILLSFNSINALNDDEFLLNLANKTYNYFLAADSNNNGFLDGWYDPLDEIDGLLFSIGKYRNSWWEFDEYNPIDYDYYVGRELPNVFPRVLSDYPITRSVYIHFNLTEVERQKELTLFLNTMSWGPGAINKVQLYVNSNFVGQFSLGSIYTEKSFNFSSNYFLVGRNKITVNMSCLYCNSWFVWDAIQLGEKDKIGNWHKYNVGEAFDDKASPEEVGFYMLSHIGAYEMGLINLSTASSRITSDLLTLEGKTRVNGLFYRYYNTHKNEAIIPNVLPSIGNAMLAASLITINQWALEKGFTTISNESSSILNGINLSYFWDPTTKLFYHDSNKIGRWDFYSDEGRLLSFVAFALNQISYQDFENNLQALNQTTLYYDVSTNNSVVSPTSPGDIKVDRASWDGSIFTYLVPALFIQEYRTNYQDNTINPAVEAQITYANNSGYRINNTVVWGISDAYNPSLAYCWDYVGTPPTAANYYHGHIYESCPGLITPHASALALLSDYSDKAVENIQVLGNDSELYDGDYGFKDSINVLSGNVTDRFLTLDQEWIFLSLMNKLNGTIWKYFYKDPDVVKAYNVMYKDEFVTVNGTIFYLNGKPFYFAGTNNYYIWRGRYNCTWPYDSNEGCTSEVLDDAKALNLTVIRTWGFVDGYDYWGSLQPAPRVYNETNFQKYDRMIKEAGDRNLKLMIPFINNWDAYGGMCQYVEWCGLGSCDQENAPVHDQFYNNTCTKDLYKDYITYFLNRTNTLTGIKYKDDPTIFAWQLANEPRARSDQTGQILYNWILETSAFVKSIDNNHLLTTGEDGFYLNKSDIYGYEGTDGQDYIWHHNITDIDFASFHLYPWTNDYTLEKMKDWITEHTTEAHQILGKPATLNEFGISRYDTTRNRDRYMDEFYTTSEVNHLNGDIFWMLCDHRYNDKYCVYYPEDNATVEIIIEHANRMKNLNLSNNPPEVEPIENMFVYLGDEVRIEVIAFDEDNDSLYYSINDDRFTQFDNVFIWQPQQEDIGEHTIRVAVNDGFYSIKEYLTITVINTTCVTPTSAMSITKTMILCSGTYNISGIKIDRNNLLVICNSTILQGGGTGNGVQINKDHTTLKNCKIKNYQYGIYISDVGNHNIINNTLEYNYQDGIRGWHSDDNLFSNNLIINSSNCFLLHDTSSSTFINNTVRNCSNGFAIWWSSYYNQFENNIVENNENGFWFDWYSDNNFFRGNILINNNMGFNSPAAGYGMHYNNTFVENELKNNIYGFYLGASIGFNVGGNKIINNSYGLYIINSNNITIYENNLIDNSKGIKVDSSNNTIYHNNFINNSIQAINWFINNSWDSRKEGNYWSNYDSEEEGCFDLISDFICDSPYVFNYLGSDNYPFTKQNGWLFKEFEIKLNTGWNLISFPLELNNKSFEHWFDGIDYDAFYYNNSKWFAPIEINNKLGYWLKSNETKNITLIGVEIENKTINLNEGWNLIGHPYLNETNILELYNNVTVFAYNGSWYSYDTDRAFNTLTKFVPGYGYWVKKE